MSIKQLRTCQWHDYHSSKYAGAVNRKNVFQWNKKNTQHSLLTTEKSAVDDNIKGGSSAFSISSRKRKVAMLILCEVCKINSSFASNILSLESRYITFHWLNFRLFLRVAREKTSNLKADFTNSDIWFCVRAYLNFPSCCFSSFCAVSSLSTISISFSSANLTTFSFRASRSAETVST